MLRHRGHSTKHSKKEAPARRAPAERKPKMLLHAFKTFTKERMSIEELVEMAAIGRLLKHEFLENKVDPPEIIDINLKSLRREIKSKQADQLEAQLKQAQQTLDHMKSPGEKRESLEKTIQLLQARLENTV